MDVLTFSPTVGGVFRRGGGVNAYPLLATGNVNQYLRQVPAEARFCWKYIIMQKQITL